MSTTKHDLQLMMKTYGYDLNPYTSKETLVNLLHLHSKALEKGIDVPKMNDHQLRCSLNEHNVTVGPVISHTRAIYQRKLLEAITNEISEGADDEIEDNQDEFHTPPIPDDGIVTRSGKTLFPTT
ncbi:unnamed protein product [Adineta steineri]|nr:unnamed protein product [Adineta steineri]CAF1383106.1 unnamed protein product [Adineta steineri]CAF3656038.1 unnamed protein product [Adineta steineri]CAF3841289.1 unnamed protein product [Adineta steineri]